MSVPTRVYKGTLYVVDVDNGIGDMTSFRNELEYRLQNSWLAYYKLEDLIVSPEFEWHDDIDLNSAYSSKEVYEKYFRNESRGSD
ncbi:hypothetical protein ACE4Z8_03290 [Enterococcus avium]|uniref:hypothetical protein n=1 Tax=Enterococcus avium TaxID=33945 RepID=UPI002890EBB4|nr:hypothetical protein [Enterococcus avium]MDT2387381.1 hypothetical protein [Enterococcus avium]MDT2485105.1 hypothetical protein [Enterococcus avium]MDT2498688.1 hypothetical protein [Enterococcus avium]MDT2502238.1 hypothetical protein [Enterococcus avium]MDT2511468.1 hypothetical protein [Enterococcus avium]